jgi:hypothetical protein
MTKGKAAPAKTKSAPKAKLTDAERHQRFVDMAHEVDADERPQSFDDAFSRVAIAPPPTKDKPLQP